MFLIKLLGLVFILGIAGGVVFVAMTDVPVKQEIITKTIPSDGLLNDE